MAIGALLVAFAIIGGLVLLIAGGDGDDSSNNSPQVSELQDRFLKHTVVDVQKGISVRRPKTWRDSKRDHNITVQSRDRCLTMTLSAPAEASRANGLHDDAIRGLKQLFSNAKVAVGPTPNGQQIGGLPTRSNTLTIREKGLEKRVLLSVGKGDKYAYVTEVVLGSPACQDDLNLANLVLTSVEYTK